MKSLKEKFIVATKDTVISASVVIEKNDIGIIVSKHSNDSIAHFMRVGEEVKISNEAYSFIDIDKTGDSFPQKICNVCHKLLDTNLFAKNQNAKNNRSVRRPSCKNCRIIMEGTDVPSRIKNEWTKNKPHLVEFKCPICLKITIPDLTSKVVLDHDHDTGAVRTWICDSCNTGIGRFKDDPVILQRAINYLKKYKKD